MGSPRGIIGYGLVAGFLDSDNRSKSMFSFALTAMDTEVNNVTPQ